MTKVYTYQGAPLTVNYTRYNLRGPNFDIYVQGSGPSNQASSYTKHTPSRPNRTYIGRVVEYPGALATAQLRDDGSIRSAITFESGHYWKGSGLTVGALAYDGVTSPILPPVPVLAGGAGANLHEADTAFDLHQSVYTGSGSDTDSLLENVENSVNEVNALYLRDLATVHHLGRLVVRSDAASSPYQNGNLAHSVEWQNVLSQILPATSWDTNSIILEGSGGGAHLGVIGTANAWSWSGGTGDADFTGAWRHEVGHHWGAGDFQGGGSEGPTIMNGNALMRVSAAEASSILPVRNLRASAFRLTGPFAIPLPPRAYTDRADLPFDPAQQSQPITFDVLANDSDSNGHALTILSFDATSAAGGTIARSVGTGPGGRDRLIYTPPTSGPPQDDVPGTLFDSFYYRIQDSTGQTSTSFAAIGAPPPDLMGHWTLDEGTGTSAADASPYGGHGSLQGGASWSTGRLGGGAVLDGVDDQIAVSLPNSTLNSMTIAGWVKRNGNQPAYSGIAFSRAEAPFGLHFGIANELRYHWESGANPSYNFDSGLVVPDGVWTFVSLTVTPTQATLSMKPEGGALQTATATGEFKAISIGKSFTLGRDPWDAARYLKGSLDDIRVYGRALSTQEIANLASGKGSLSTPSPAVGSIFLQSGSPNYLSWAAAAGYGAVTYQVYTGNNFYAVQNATTSSSEYRGSTSTNGFAIDPAATGTTFWRVDFNDGATTTKGSVWHFKVTAPPAPPVAWWKFDETSGTTATDSTGNGATGTLQNGPTWSPGLYQGGLTLDGTSQWVHVPQVPVLPANAPNITVGGWIKRQGNQAEGTGIFFARPSSHAGLFLTASHELRYVWGGVWWNGTGLYVPDNVWTYCAIVVKPGMLTLHLRPLGGKLQSASFNNPETASINSELYLGRDPWGPAFKGQLDDFRVYAEALSETQIGATTRDNRAPAFASNPFARGDAAIGWAYSGTLAGSARDPDGDPLTYTKVSGPAWLTVGPNGALGGTPASGDAGSNTFTIKANDPNGLDVTATLTINVRALDPAADEDGDGYSNGLETALGTSPVSAGSQPSSVHNGLHGWWRLNESSGSVAADTNGNTAFSGTLLNGPAWVAGSTGNGLQFNGTNQSVQLPALASVNSNTVTLSCWIKRDGNQPFYGGIAFMRNPDTGLNFYGSTHQLGYTWNQAGNTWQFASNLTVPDNIWTFVGVVVEPTKATLYMQPAGGVMQTAVNNVTHAPCNFSQPLYLGQDTYGGDRFFKGAMDEFRIHARALNAAELQQLATATLPAPWSAQDIGAVGIPGSVSSASGSFAVAGSGDLGGSTDKFRYAWQALSGDGSITARVASQQNTATDAKAGLMIRESSAEGSRNLILEVTPGGGVVLQSRQTTGGNTATVTSASGTAPKWLRLTRTGNTIRAYHSDNGTNWTQLGGDLTLTMAANIQIGFAVSSWTDSALSTAVFDNVTVVP